MQDDVSDEATDLIMQVRIASHTTLHTNAQHTRWTSSCSHCALNYSARRCTETYGPNAEDTHTVGCALSDVLCLCGRSVAIVFHPPSVQFLELSPETRLGTHGADAVKAHPFFASIDFKTLLDQPAMCARRCCPAASPQLSCCYAHSKGVVLPCGLDPSKSASSGQICFCCKSCGECCVVQL